MLEKLAKQSAIYGISTIVGRLLGYLLTPYFTRMFTTWEYGVITDLYALIPFALVLLSMGMESSYFRFATRAEQQSEDQVALKEAISRLFSTTWAMTLVAAVGFFVVVMMFLEPACRAMGKVYVANPRYVEIVAAIIVLDVAAIVPFVRLRHKERARSYVALKLLSIVLQVALSIGFGLAGLYATEFGVGWVLVANLIASGAVFLAILATLRNQSLCFDRALVGLLLAYSLPLLVSGIAGTATDFIDRQMIKYITPIGAMSQLGIYGAVTKIAVVMTLFTQMYRLAAEPFFLSNFKREEFVEMTAAAMKYFVMVSMLLFLAISLFRDIFSLIVGVDYREGIYILPVVLGANIFLGVWLNLSFWYKREERTRYAIIITLSGLVVAVVANLILIPRWGYYGAAWARFIAEGAMVVVSYALCMRFFPVPYDLRRIAEYVVLAIVLLLISELVTLDGVFGFGLNLGLIAIYMLYAQRREQIDVRAMFKKILRG